MLVGISSGCFLSRLNLLFKMSFILAVCFTDFHFRVNSVPLNRGPTYTSPFFSSLFPLSQSNLQSPGYHQQDDLVYPHVKSLHVQPGLSQAGAAQECAVGGTLSPPAGSALDARAAAQLSAMQRSFRWLQSRKLTGLPRTQTPEHTRMTEPQ